MTDRVPAPSRDRLARGLVWSLMLTAITLTALLLAGLLAALGDRPGRDLGLGVAVVGGATALASWGWLVAQLTLRQLRQEAGPTHFDPP
jgi:hypothetical protein